MIARTEAIHRHPNGTVESLKRDARGEWVYLIRRPHTDPHVSTIDSTRAANLRAFLLTCNAHGNPYA